MEEAAKERLDGALKELNISGHASVSIAPPEIALIETASRARADLVVVGTTGRTALRRVLLGSVAEFVAMEAPCSVLMVRLHKE